MNRNIDLPIKGSFMTRSLGIGLTFLFFALPSLAQSPDTCAHLKPSNKAPEKIAQFAFLIGEHDVTLHAWTGNQWTPARPIKARWRGWYGLQGMAIFDEWLDPDPTRGNVGINVRFFDDAEDLWKMMWISTGGRQVQDLRAAIQDGSLTMWQVHPPRPGWKAEFEVIDSQSWARNSYKQNAQGDWVPEFRLVATRTACELVE